MKLNTLIATTFAVATLTVATVGLTAGSASAGERVTAGVTFGDRGTQAGIEYSYRSGPRPLPYRAAPRHVHRPYVVPGRYVAPRRWAPVRPPVQTVRGPVKTRKCSPIMKKRRVFLPGQGWRYTKVQVGRECRTIWR
ncbi:MAG: hypothetical protein C0606_05730 [Hyphomicrobiales bacterium]|nr:MAG: hypothetical protein C0606_05730 [Hyphomicrobiales bacterium]